MARASRVVLVYDNGRLSARVARMLGVCGYPEVTYLKGGRQVGKQQGSLRNETARRGDERRTHPGGNPDGPGPIGRLTPPVFFAGLAGAGGLIGGLQSCSATDQSVDSAGAVARMLQCPSPSCFSPWPKPRPGSR